MGMGQDSTQGGLYPASDPNTIAGMVGNYQTAMPNLAKTYIQNLGKGVVDMPSFQEMYQSYRDVATQQADKAGASITESMGSQGARYGSDMMRMQGQNQRDLATDLRSQASNYQMALRGQQSKEVAGAVGYLSDRDAMGMTYLWQDMLRRTSPPPLLGAAASQPGGPPGPTAY